MVSLGHSSRLQYVVGMSERVLCCQMNVFHAIKQLITVGEFLDSVAATLEAALREFFASEHRTDHVVSE